MPETSGIVELYAQHLEAKASRLVVRFTALFGVVGAVLGGFPLFQGHGVVSGPLAFGTLLLGAFAGAYIGYTIGQRRAVEVRFQAQLALHQLQVEQSLIARAPVVAPVVPAPVVQQQPVPVAAPPAPVAPAPAPVQAPPLVQPPLMSPPVAPVAPVAPPPAEPPAAAVVAPPPLLAPAPPLSSTGS